MSRCLLLVHAHPDDECLSTGGTIARYAAEGVHVGLVTCTGGELGEIAEVPGLGPPEDLLPVLGEARARELAEACRRLAGPDGEVDLRMLGFHDSGMAGTPGNDDPVAFVNQDLSEPVARIVEIVRELRPQVLVTYNEYGFYGHPDHIRAHQAAVAAVEAAADAGYGEGEPHRVAKVYFTAVPRSALEAFAEAATELGFDEEFMSPEEIERIGTDDERVTTALDVGAYVDRKVAAIEAHRTQLGTTRRFLELPPDVRDLVLSTEHFVLASSSARRGEGTEHDLFEGVEA